jgi:hypothetical protein
MILLLGCLLFTIVYSYVEATHDYYVIKNDKGYNNLSAKWHSWGLYQNALTFLPIFIAVGFYNIEIVMPIMIVMSFTFWQFHDSIISYKLYKKFFYLSSHGFDGKMLKFFKSARNLSLLRILIIVSSLAWGYLMLPL